MSVQHYVFVLPLMGLLSFCASQTATKTEEGNRQPATPYASPTPLYPSNGNLENRINTINNGTNSVLTPACLSGAASPSGIRLAQPGAQNIAGTQLPLLTNGDQAKKSLCQILAESGKKVGVFAFSGVTCLSCQDEARMLEQTLPSRGLSQHVAHVLVMTDFQEDATVQEMQGFQNKFAPRALLTRDINAGLWKYFSVNPAMPTRPTVVIMNLNMEATVINQEGRVGDIVPQIEAMVARSR